MKSVRVSVNAKINLSLNILGTTQNNYHLLNSVMASVSIYDAISIVKRSDKNIYMSSRDMAVGPRNSAVKAANALITAFSTLGCDMHLTKRIPFSAGLGGSSADAAAVLMGLKKLYNITDEKAIKSIALLLGSDVPYMLEGGFKLLGGVGESVQNIDTDAKLFLVIAKPERGVSTQECYKRYDKTGGEAGDTDKLIEGLKTKNLPLIAANTVNALERAATEILPDIAWLKGEMQKEKPLSCFMTGSGSAVVALCESKERADFIASKIKQLCPWSGSFETVLDGITIN